MYLRSKLVYLIAVDGSKMNMQYRATLKPERL